MLSNEYGDVLDNVGAEYLSRIREGAKRLDSLITALLGLSRLMRQEIRHARVDLSEIARSIARDVRAIDPANAVEFRIQADLCAVGDASMLRVVVGNLLENALKFSRSANPPVVEFGRDENGFFVRDNGIGFDPSQSEKIFEFGMSAHSRRDFSGDGIGLATVHRIITKHEGRIWAESQEAKGATFYFVLP